MTLPPRRIASLPAPSSPSSGALEYGAAALALGAVVGAAVGALAGSVGLSAAIGAGIGAVGGAVYGYRKAAPLPSSSLALTLSVSGGGGTSGYQTSYSWQPPTGGSVTDASSDSGAATAEVAPPGAYISATTPGSANVTVSYTDASGAAQTQVVGVTVVA